MDDRGDAYKSAMHAASPETVMFCKKGQCKIPTNRGWQENHGTAITYNIKGVPLHAVKTHGGMKAFLC